MSLQLQGRRIRRIVRRLRPYKGSHSYEVQIGAFVLQARHRHADPFFQAARFRVWRDELWRL